MHRFFMRLAWTLVVLVSLCHRAYGQQPPAQIVVDQTGLPLPGVTIQLLDGDRVVATTTTNPEGRFVLDARLPGAMILALLDGFEPARVDRRVDRIELVIAR